MQVMQVMREIVHGIQHMPCLLQSIVVQKKAMQMPASPLLWEASIRRYGQGCRWPS
jgi:hypothetical protein